MKKTGSHFLHHSKSMEWKCKRIYIGTNIMKLELQVISLTSKKWNTWDNIVQNKAEQAPIYH